MTGAERAEARQRALRGLRERLRRLVDLDDAWPLLDAAHDALDRASQSFAVIALQLPGARGTWRILWRGRGEREAGSLDEAAVAAAARAWRAGELQHRAALSADPQTPAPLTTCGSRIDAPFGRGVLTVGDTAERAFDEGDRQFLRDLTDLVDLGTRFLPEGEADTPAGAAPTDHWDLSALPVARLTPEGEVLDGTPRLRALLAWPDRGGHLRTACCRPEACRALLARLRQDGEARQELQMRGPGGGTLWMRANLRQCPAPSGAVVEAFFEDVTAGHRAAARQALVGRVREAGRRLEDAQDLQPLLAGMVADLCELDLDVARCSLFLRLPDGGWRHHDSDRPDGPREPRDVAALEALRAADEVRYHPDEGDAGGEAGTRCRLDVPLLSGALTVEGRRPQAFTPDDRALLADLAAVLDGALLRLRRPAAVPAAGDEAPQLSLAAWHAVLDTVPAGLVHTTPDGDFRFQNERCRQVFGYSDEDRRSGNILDLYVDPADRRELVEHLERHGEHAYEYRLRHKDGRILHVRGHSHRMRDPTGEVIYQGVMEDVSPLRQRQLAERLQVEVGGDVLALQRPEDLDSLLTRVRRGLGEVGLDCQALRFLQVEGTDAQPVVRVLGQGAPALEHGTERARRVRQLVQRPGTRGLRCTAAPGGIHYVDGGVGVLEVHAGESLDESHLPLLANLAHTLGGGLAALRQRSDESRRTQSLEREVAQRRAAETALRASEERYRRLMEGLPVGVVHTDAEGRLLFWNTTFEGLLGYDAETLRAQGLAGLYEDPAARDGVLAALEQSPTHTYEAAFRHRAGHIIWLRGHMRRFKPGTAGTLQVQGIFVDITEQRLQARRDDALHELREEVWRMRGEQDIQGVIAAAYECLRQLDVPVEGCAVHVIDEQDEAHPVVTYLRPARGDDWHREVHEVGTFLVTNVLDRRASGEPAYRPDMDAEADAGEVRELIQARHGVRVRTVLDMPFSMGLLSANNRQPNAFGPHDLESMRIVAEVIGEGFLRLADLRQLERRNQALVEQMQERERLEGQLRQAQRLEAVGHLTSGLAHNFNNILQAILSNLEMAAAGRGDLKVLVAEANNATQRAAELVRQLLTYTGRAARAETRDVPLREVLDQSVTLLQPATVGRPLAFDYEAPDEEICIRSELGQLEQVFLNLLVNARDAVAESASPRIGLRVSASADTVAVLVSDNGTGMSEQTVARIFDPFFTTKGVGTGTGLGLFTAYGILQRQGGHIECDSRPGEGTTFTVTLPRSAGSSDPVDAPPASEVPRGRGERILVVDDEDAVRTSLCRLLHHLGYETVEADDGQAALDLYDEQPDRVDAVLLDLSMPRLSGRQVSEALGSRDPALPVVIMTGLQEDAPEGVPLVMKPFDLPQLTGALRTALGATR